MMDSLRSVLLGLYLLAAIADAGCKALAANATINFAIARRVPAVVATTVEAARRPSGNFEILRAASRHLISREDLYASYPRELQDRFKYSPTFALLFAPLAWLPWPLALFLWSSLNALLLFAAVDRLLPGRAGDIALGCLLPEVWRSMQNAQSNAFVAALIICTFLALERGRTWRAAATAVLGASVKIFPLAALTFAVPRRKIVPTAVAAAAVSFALFVAPLAVMKPMSLLAQYQSWSVTESVDARQRWFSVMELLHRWLGTDWPNWPVQLAGTILLLAPIVLRRERWPEPRFRRLFLCSVLVYASLFNHQAERSSYLIAFTGATIWFASEAHTTERIVLYGIAGLTIPLMSTMLPVPDALRSPTAMLYRLVAPTLAIWLVMQRGLLESALGTNGSVRSPLPLLPDSSLPEWDGNHRAGATHAFSVDELIPLLE